MILLYFVSVRKHFGSGIAFEHAHKLNQRSPCTRAVFRLLDHGSATPYGLRCQLSIPWYGSECLSETGNTSKLFTAKALSRLNLNAVTGGRLSYVLLDSWFMIGPVIRQKQDLLGYHAFGQVRHDHALILTPLSEPKRRGTPRVYGYHTDDRAVSSYFRKHQRLRKSSPMGEQRHSALQKLPMPSQNSQGAGNQHRVDRVRAQGKTS